MTYQIAILLTSLFLVASPGFAFESLFDTRTDYDAGSNPYSVFAADPDGDGDYDPAMANRGSGNVSILLNRIIITDIEDDISNELSPEHCFPYQDYPNPFNPMTRIDYTVSRFDYIIISIYNLPGREVTESRKMIFLK